MKRESFKWNFIFSHQLLCNVYKIQKHMFKAHDSSDLRRKVLYRLHYCKVVIVRELIESSVYSGYVTDYPLV